MRISNIIEKNFLAIIILFSVLSFLNPDYFFWAKNTIKYMLSFVAFCVGLTLDPSSYKSVLKNKNLIFTILFFKYSIAPIVTYSVCYLTHIPMEYTIGLVILTCCPAANTGNIMCYIARGNTPMIVTTTMVGAIISPFITPLIIFIILHKVVHIEIIHLLLTIITCVVLPIAAGIVLNYFFLKFFEPVKEFIPSIGIFAVSIIISAIVSSHAAQLQNLDIKIPFICSNLIILFIFIGFIFSKSIKSDHKNSIAMSFEVGTFDGVLGILLSLQIVGDTGTISVVLFSVLNLIIGAVTAIIFRKTQPKALLI